MIQYFKDILITFSKAQRIWALIILCISVFFITFGSDIIDALKPDPTQQNLVVKRQRSVITSLNTQLDSLTLRVDDLTQEVIDGQTQCTTQRINREKEIITQIDEIMNMVRGNVKPHQMVIKPHPSPPVTSDTVVVSAKEVRYIEDDNSKQIMKGLCDLKKNIKNKK
jgi:TolA-binding protein